MRKLYLFFRHQIFAKFIITTMYVSLNFVLLAITSDNGKWAEGLASWQGLAPRTRYAPVGESFRRIEPYMVPSIYVL